ncbi:MAG: DUF6390 family protein [Candidatus Diapherotrites archaeon]|nr:DUF6390 family protein [Candidatus Diapherotrites archaeon]
MGKIEALSRACKYALAPNKLGYCGKCDYSEIYISFLKNPKQEDVPKIEESLKSFRAMYSYLKLIAEYNNVNPFSEKAIEAYWLGNSLLDNVPVEAVKSLIKNDFIEIPLKQREMKADFLKKKVLLQHSFHVLYINFLNPRLKPIAKNMDNCIVKYGKVLEIWKDKVKTKSMALSYNLGEIKVMEKVLSFENPYRYDLKKGDLVSAHWGNIIEKIDKIGKSKIKESTFSNLALANSYLGHF